MLLEIKFGCFINKSNKSNNKSTADAEPANVEAIQISKISKNPFMNGDVQILHADAFRFYCGRLRLQLLLRNYLNSVNCVFIFDMTPVE